MKREVENMIPQTIGREYDVGKVAPVQCIKNDMLKDIEIKEHCFLLLIIHEGTAYFQIEIWHLKRLVPVSCALMRENSRSLLKTRIEM